MVMGLFGNPSGLSMAYRTAGKLKVTISANTMNTLQNLSLSIMVPPLGIKVNGYKADARRASTPTRQFSKKGREFIALL
jgi:hypothetical protein